MEAASSLFTEESASFTVVAHTEPPTPSEFALHMFPKIRADARIVLCPVCMCVGTVTDHGKCYGHNL